MEDPCEITTLLEIKLESVGSEIESLSPEGRKTNGRETEG